MRKPAIYSAILHIVMLVIFLIGIPLPQHQVPITEQPVIMEFDKIDVVTKAPVLSPDNAKKDDVKPIKKPEPPKEQPKEDPAEKKEEPAEDKPEPVKETVKEPESETEPVPIPKKDPPKKEKPKEEKKEEPKKKPEEKKAKKEVKNDKAVVNLDPKKKAKPKPLAKEKSADELIDSLLGESDADQGQKSAPAQMVGNEISATERDMIISHISKCWLLQPGAKDGANLVVEVKMNLSPEGNVLKAEVTNKNQSNDPHFEVAAESAVRAVLDPKCNPIPFPAEKYEQWKNYTFRFNPKNMY